MTGELTCEEKRDTDCLFEVYTKTAGAPSNTVDPQGMRSGITVMHDATFEHAHGPHRAVGHEGSRGVGPALKAGARQGSACATAGACSNDQPGDEKSPLALYTSIAKNNGQAIHTYLDS